jgi:tetratricopeptide (TPR) repeat protein
MKLYFSLFLIFLLSNSAFAQPVSISDSLENVLNNYKLQDTTRVNLLLQCANAFYGKNPNKIQEYSNKALLLSNQIGFKKGKAESLRFLGVADYMKGDFAKTEISFAQALEINQQIKNVKGIISCLSNLGSVNMVQNKYVQALDYYKKGIKISNEHNDLLNSGIIYGNIGVIYSELKDYENALKHFEGGVLMHTKIQYKPGIATGLGNIGNVYFKQKKLVLANNFYNKALNVNKEIANQFSIAREYGNIANTQLELNNLPEAYTSYTAALAINKQLKNKKGEAVIKQGLANYFEKKEMLDSALYYSKAALLLAEDINIKDVQNEALLTISKILEKKKEYQESYDAYKKHTELKNNLENDENKKALLRLETQYEFDKKEDAYKNAKILDDAKLVQQSLLIENSKLLLSEAEKAKEVNRLNYLQVQANLEKQELVTNEKSKKLIIAEQEKDLQKSKNKTLQKEKNLKELQLKNFWLYALIAAITIGLLLILIFALIRIKNLKAKNILNQKIAAQKEESFTLQNNLKELEMNMLRSQMNPHFIFNSINSINNFILHNDRNIASNYLTTFAKLMRNILDNSKLTSISLKKEIETLCWYMDLEKLRLANKFEYKINIDEEVDEEFITIPPLILQPFVENSIWHGIRHSNKNGHININIKNLPDAIEIEITDDGIGRVASNKIKTTASHTSYGIDTTIERIKIIDKNNNINILDLYNNNVATGTQVTIQLKH